MLFSAALQLSHNWTLPVGSLVVPVKQLLSEPELILDQWLHLDGASPESQILLRAELKVLQLTFFFSPPVLPSDSFCTYLSILHSLIPPFFYSCSLFRQYFNPLLSNIVIIISVTTAAKHRFRKKTNDDIATTADADSQQMSSRC